MYSITFVEIEYPCSFISHCSDFPYFILEMCLLCLHIYYVKKKNIKNATIKASNPCQVIDLQLKFKAQVQNGYYVLCTHTKLTKGA